MLQPQVLTHGKVRSGKRKNNQKRGEKQGVVGDQQQPVRAGIYFICLIHGYWSITSVYIVNDVGQYEVGCKFLHLGT